MLSQRENLLSYIDPKPVSDETTRGSSQADSFMTQNGEEYSSTSSIILIVLTVIGVTILDFGLDACQSPYKLESTHILI